MTKTNKVALIDCLSVRGCDIWKPKKYPIYTNGTDYYIRHWFHYTDIRYISMYEWNMRLVSIIDKGNDL